MPAALDHNAITPLDPRVGGAMRPWLCGSFGNASSRQHRWRWDALEAVDQARWLVREATHARVTCDTSVVGGRAWTQSTRHPDWYVVGFDIDGGISTVGVTTDLYNSLNPGERVRVTYQRTRFSNKVLVTDVSR